MRYNKSDNPNRSLLIWFGFIIEGLELAGLKARARLSREQTVGLRMGVYRLMVLRGIKMSKRNSELVMQVETKIDEAQLFKRVVEIIERRKSRASDYANQEATMMF